MLYKNHVPGDVLVNEDSNPFQYFLYLGLYDGCLPGSRNQSGSGHLYLEFWVDRNEIRTCTDGFLFNYVPYGITARLELRPERRVPYLHHTRTQRKATERLRHVSLTPVTDLIHRMDCGNGQFLIRR